MDKKYLRIKQKVQFIFWSYKNWLIGFFLASVVFICMTVLSYEWSCRVIELDLDTAKGTVYNIAKALIWYAIFLISAVLFLVPSCNKNKDNLTIFTLINYIIHYKDTQYNYDTIRDLTIYQIKNTFKYYQNQEMYELDMKYRTSGNFKMDKKTSEHWFFDK